MTFVKRQAFDLDARVYTVVDASGSVNVNETAAPVSLPTPGQTAVIAFPGTQGQAVRVRITANTIGQIQVFLRSPSGSTMTWTTSTLASFDLASQTLGSTGTYSILVDPVVSGTGTITVAVTSP